MKTLNFSVFCLLSSILVSLPHSAEPAKSVRPVVAVIPKGTMYEFWKSVHAGAIKAGQEEGADILWQGPAKEDDRNGQVEVLKNFVSKKVDAIVIAPLDETALARPVEAAVKRKIPVVIIDSDLKSKAFSSFVATDNFAAGKIAAKYLAEVFMARLDSASFRAGHPVGRVILMRYLAGSASNTHRENGFLAGLAEYAPKVEILSSDQYSGVTTESAMQTAQKLLTQFPTVEAIFSPNAPTTSAMLRALQLAKRTGNVYLVGFDATEELLKSLKYGEIAGLVVQDPFRIGYLGVKTALAAKRKEKVEKRIDTGSRLILPSNLADPEVEALLHPDLMKWLGE